MFNIRKNSRTWLMALTVCICIVYSSLFPLRAKLEQQLISSGIAYDNLFFHIAWRALLAGIITGFIFYVIIRLGEKLLGRIRSSFEGE